MLSVYSQFRDFHVFKRFKSLFGDWWNMDILVVFKEDKKFFYDSLSQLNNPLVKSLLESSLFKRHFLRSVHAALSKKTEPVLPPRLLPWRQTGLSLFVIPFGEKKSAPEACLVATGFAPKDQKKLSQALLYLGLSEKAIEQKAKSLKELSSTDEVYIQKMLKILADELFALLQERQKQSRLIEKLNKSQARGYGFLRGKSPAMRYIFGVLERIKDEPTGVLIEGENGVGKRLLAKTIHAQSSRAAKPFHLQNFSAFNGKILELDIFGYSQNIFPESFKGKRALLEKIQGGTLFLNEIGGASPGFQGQLLKFLKDGVFFSQGDSKPKKSSARVLYATSKDLKELVEKGQFNEELYFTISAMSLKLPPLKQRKEDIPLLIDHFLDLKSPQKKARLSPKALSLLYNYPWPGNIRELESEIEKLVSLGSNNQELLTERDISAHIKNHHSPLASVLDSDKSNLKLALRSVEKRILLDCLRKNNWNKSRVAKLLGASRTSVVLKIKEYGIVKEEGA